METGPFSPDQNIIDQQIEAIRQSLAGLPPEQQAAVARPLEELAQSLADQRRLALQNGQPDGMDEKRLESLLRISQLKMSTQRELLDFALDEVVALSNSKLGYIYYYSEGKQEFTLHAWSKEVMQECAIPNPPTIYSLEKTGLWGEAVRQRRPIIANDFQAPNPLKKGYPAEHAALHRFMTVPVLIDGKIVAVVGVGNKPDDYTAEDVRQLTLMMDSVWEIVQRKLAEEEVEKVHAHLEELVEERTAQLKASEMRYRSLFENKHTAMLLIDPQNGEIVDANPAAVQYYGYEREQFVKMNVAALNVLPESQIKELLAQARKEQRPYYNLKHRLANQEIRDVEVYTGLINFGGRVLFYSVIHDITDRQQAKESLQQKTEELDRFFNVTLDLMCIADTNGYLRRVNRAWETILGYSVSELTGHPFLDYVHPDDIERTLAAMADLSAQRPVIHFVNRYRCKDGSYRWIEWHTAPAGELIYAAARDITERMLAEAEVAKANDKLIQWVNSLELHNKESNLIRQMDDLLQVCNTSEEAYTVVQQFGPLLFPSTSGALYLIDNSRRAVEAATIWGDKLQSERIFAPDDCWTLRRGQFHQWNTLSPGLRCHHIPKSFSGDYLGAPMSAAGELMGLIHIESTETGWRSAATEELARSIADHLALSLSNIKLRETLRAQSIRDPLTGLFNRRYMEESLERELHRATRAQTQLAIIMLDIDHFKDYNDIYGHEAGDAVLHELGALLQSTIRAEDIACRFGGEEFILILPETSLEICCERAEQIRTAVRAMTIDYQYKSLGIVTISAGVAIFPTHAKNTPDLLRKVDKALYQAKHNGRDRVETADLFSSLQDQEI